MSTPSFTAETSLYPSRRSYRTARARGPARARILAVQGVRGRRFPRQIRQFGNAGLHAKCHFVLLLGYHIFCLYFIIL